MLDFIKRAWKWTTKWINLIDFFCRISSLENNIENAMRKCEMLSEDMRDRMLKDEVRTILYRLEHAHSRIICLRKMGTDLIMYEEDKIT